MLKPDKWSHSNGKKNGKEKHGKNFVVESKAKRTSKVVNIVNVLVFSDGNGSDLSNGSEMLMKYEVFCFVLRDGYTTLLSPNRVHLSE